MNVFNDKCVLLLNWIYSLPESKMNFPGIYLIKKKEKEKLCLPSAGKNLHVMWIFTNWYPYMLSVQCVLALNVL